MKGKRSRKRGCHRAVKIRFVAFVRIREKRELGDAEDVSVDVLHALSPHQAGREIIEHTHLETCV